MNVADAGESSLWPAPRRAAQPRGVEDETYMSPARSPGDMYSTLDSPWRRLVTKTVAGVSSVDHQSGMRFAFLLATAVLILTAPAVFSRSSLPLGSDPDGTVDTACSTEHAPVCGDDMVT
jgi:hypothetical protein